MDNPNCFSWNTIIRAYSESENQCLEAVVLFSEMVCSEFVEPNRFTYPSVLKACVEIRGIEEGKQVHGQIIKCGGELNCDEFVVSNLVRVYSVCGVMDDARRLFGKCVVRDGNVIWNVLIDGYLRNGEFESARKLFDLMPERSVVSWNAMIAGYAQNGFFKEAVEIFREMQLGNECPNYVTLVSVLPAISRFGQIDMYSKCGSIEKAVQVFQRLPQTNVITWNAIIGGLAMHGRAKDALDYFSKMEKSGVKPSDVSYISVLAACSHAGLVDLGKFYFDQMVRVVGLKPRIEHYGCLVDLFGRAGLLEEAEKLILSMTIKPDDVIWKALLGACDWGSVAETRMRMKELNIRKDPGCSWIELDGMINEFLVEDDSNPRAEEIHLMLEEIVDKLRLAGHRPDTRNVLLNMDDREKESTLYHHSEKIAIAFGLISTSHKTPLRIVKNLRICRDCHAAVKIISKAYDRRIVVRDRSRFHHFENGLCSCMDYW
ncbi:hypothetical protein IFM89_025836 [Coptis chinensis]|uniref:DYW domain-containing protein n=1 Tax=Coptis chinensis TaxID=261450 RepID=A0A835LSX1_9MAGN|nr:hypothetical protein IFM89_025836 [Coptis chinensis]